MNLRKHVAGFALFSVIVGCAVFINALLSAPIASVPPVSLDVATHINRAPQPVNFKVRQVSLDLMHHKSYTQLRLERLPGQPAPERLWVRTVFIAPGYMGIIGLSKAEIDQPFAQSDQSEFVATDSSIQFMTRNAPRIEYFARVFVSTSPSDDSIFQNEIFDLDILPADAVPVVIHWPDGTKPSADARKPF